MTGGPGYRETVHRFGRNDALVGVLTRPDDATELPVVLLGAGIIHKIGPSRVSVELARALASTGHPVLRFDLSGIGDSERAPEASLHEAVLADIDDAVSFLLESSPDPASGVALLGYCSGADNGLHVAARDERVRALCLFDPSVPETEGFYRRRMRDRATSARSWLNVVSGRSAWVRLADRLAPDDHRAPDHYGLLTLSPEEMDQAAGALGRRGVPLLYVLSSGAHETCNSPDQIRESQPTGFSEETTTVAWRPDFDHILSAPAQRRTFIDLVLNWLDRGGARD